MFSFNLLAAQISIAKWSYVAHCDGMGAYKVQLQTNSISISTITELRIMYIEAKLANTT